MSGNEKKYNRYFNFYLTIEDRLILHKEDENFKTCWSLDDNLSSRICDTLNKLYFWIDENDLLLEKNIVKMFLSLFNQSEHYNDETVIRWLSISKFICKNKDGKWGKITSLLVNPKNLGDYSYMVLKENKIPMHFEKIAELINKTFNKKVNIKSLHNQLVFDERFVVVGNGIYSIKSEDFKPGSVKDIIHDILKEKPLSKEEVIEKVNEQRMVKESTILINLYKFKRIKSSIYTLFTLKE